MSPAATPARAAVDGSALLARELADALAVQRQVAAAPQAPAVSTAPSASERIQALIDRYHAAPEEERAAIAREVLVEIDRLLADPATDPALRTAIAPEVGAVRAQLAQAGKSPVRQAGMAAGGVILVGGGPEDVPADAIAAVVFLAILVVALTTARGKVDPDKVEEALDQIRDALRRAGQKRQPERKPDERPPPPLGPDVGPGQPKKPIRHHGNIHVQGDDVRAGQEPNYVWDQPVPATKAQAQAGLAAVRAACTPRQLADREDAFADAQDFIARTLTTAPPLVFKPCQNREVRRDPRKSTRRVDIEIISGTAFT